MNRMVSKVLKLAVGVAVLVVGGIFIHQKFFESIPIAIVHDNQWVNDVEYAIYNNRGGIVNINIDENSKEQIESAISFARGVIFAGGDDFDPSLYGSDNTEDVEDFDREIDEKELDILDIAIKQGKPVLGICRGMQLINIYYGGSLYEDIKKQFSSEVNHRNDDKTLAYHNVNIEDGTKLDKIVRDSDIEVNSYHHEGIKDLGDGLVESARSDDGLVEAIEDPGHPFLLGLQWHVESSTGDNTYNEKIIKEFMKAVRRSK